jgi:two-component sensor histidine kinase
MIETIASELAEAPRTRRPLVVGVGASTSNTVSLERFLSKLSLGNDLSVVLVLQHREALNEAWLQDVLRPLEDVRLIDLKDGFEIRGRTVYLCPANMIATLHGEQFAVRPAEQAPGERATIDSFLVSLAEQRAEQAIGVVLCGTGSEGTLGVATLKDHGGLAIAELLAGHQQDEMTESSTAAAIADFVLAAKDIPDHIEVYARHLRRLEEREGFDESLTAAAGSLDRIADILRSKTGNDFHGYEQMIFLRRVQRRMQVVQIDEIAPYVDLLRNDNDEVQHLFNDLLIGITGGSDVGLERRAQRIAERYAPAYVIVDHRFHILHLSGRTGRFMDPAAGAATLELLSLVHRDLRLELRTALSRARENNETVHADQVALGVNGHSVMVDITIEPIEESPEGQRHFIVLFKDGPLRAAPRSSGTNSDLVRSEHLERLDSELRATRERLQATIEELESTNEELKSSNQEYQSLNEELQSANEELETSREELQSGNEELTTVNGELAHRVQELIRATSDLKNFLESTQIATVFLDNDMRVMNFTPAVTQVLHLVETDVGRPIAHIKAKVPIEPLYDHARRVLRTLASAEQELIAPDSGTRYIVRMLPYRSIENLIAGVVMTFIDVSAITRAEERQRLLLAELQHRVRNTLAVVRSIARRSAQTSSTVDEYAAHLDGRLSAFTRTQAAVTRDPEAGVDLEYLLADELMAYHAREGEHVQISGPTLRLQPKAAETLSLAIHELATNAVKYGALSQPAGRVEIGWRIDESVSPPKLIFDWREIGGPQVAPPQRSGFGTEILERTLAFDLKGSTSLLFNPSGVHFTIAVPLSRRIVRSPAMVQ